MDIQIENLSLKELVELHDKIARRMWELGRTELAAKLGEFQIGDPVSFQSEGKTITGTVIRVNRKTLSVRSQEGYYFYVPPSRGDKDSVNAVSEVGVILNLVQNLAVNPTF